MIPVIGLVDISFTFVAQMISFLILLYVLNRVLYKPLLKFLDKRSEDIKRSMAQAESTEKEAGVVLDSAKEELEKARAKAHAIKNQAQQIADGESENIVKNARREAEELLARAKKETETELGQAKDELQRKTGLLAVEISERLLRSNLSDDQKRLATATYISEMDSMSGDEQ